MTLGKRSRLLLLSFLMLFVELALIRWTGSNVVYLAFFSNFVLMGSFLGIGVGFLRGKSRLDLFAWAAPLLALLVWFVLAFPVTVGKSGNGLITVGLPSGLPIWVVLPIVFLAVAVVMASIAQGVARAFAEFEPLRAYRLDILGSLAGIAGFTLLSFLGAPPLAWGAVVAVALLVLYWPRPRLLQAAAAAGILVMLGIESLDPHSFWSPYYKITIYDAKPGWALSVNGIPHQWIVSVADMRKITSFYDLPYRHAPNDPLHNVLIVGAGNGVDVANAVARGAGHIDAVEIDPRIYELGRRLNPDRPYQQPQVSVHIDDGRAFLQRSRDRYDLILFALPDSLTLVSGQSSLRLESYLFTLEAMRSARAHLAPHGVFAMYNNYREPWLVDRLAQTLESTYGHAPCVDTLGNGIAVLTIGLTADDIACASLWRSPQIAQTPVGDDRPFLYMESRTIPPLYLVTILLILAIAFVAVRLWAGPLRQMSSYADLFFMGAAFLLLETKSVVQFALLFGATWLVNALVFFGILLAVLAAIEVAARVRIARPAPLYVALFAALAVAWAVPPERLLALDPFARLAAAVALAFAPIFLANLIFAERFRDVASSSIAFGTNLLGAMAGGVLEYTSLILGYRSLLAIVALLYAFAFVFGARVAPDSSKPPALEPH